MPASRRFNLASTASRLVVSLVIVAALIPVIDTQLVSPPTAWATNYVVNLTTDGGDGTCDGTCTLRDAIGQANTNGVADIITFDSSVTAAIVLTSTLPTITDTLTIDGSGQTVTVDGANAYRVFNATAPLTLTSLTVQNGNAAGNGGGAAFGSTGTISGVTFISNTADSGGGAYFSGPATVTGTNFISNTANIGSGGAVFLGGATLSAGTFMSNTASSADGGGASFAGTAVVTGTTFVGNTSGGDGGGAIFIVGATLVAAGFTGNLASGDGGGAMFLSKTRATNISVSSNTAGFNGGGVTLSGGADSVIHVSSFRTNAAGDKGGGLSIQSAANVTLSSNFIVDNQAANDGGGTFLHAGTSAILINNFLAKNRVLAPATDRAVITLADISTRMTGRHNTLASAAAGSGLALSAGAGSLGQTVALTNTIFDGFAQGVRAGPFTTAITLDGVLWSGVTTTTQGAGITVTNAYTGAAAFVNPAADDYHLTLPSAARDRGVSTSLNVDFEGDSRPLGPAPDLGADEALPGPNTAPVAVDDTATTPEDTAITLNVLANDSDAEGTALTVAAVGTPSSGTAIISGTTQIVYTPTLNFNGQAVFTYTASDGLLTDTATVTVTVTPVNETLFLPLITR
jgi:CSLREA domain-containing protein